MHLIYNINLLPAQVNCLIAQAVHINRTGNAYSGSHNLSVLNAFFLHLGSYGSRDIRDDILALVFCSCGDLPEIHPLTCFCEQSDLDCCSANICAKYISCHNTLPLFYVKIVLYEWCTFIRDTRMTPLALSSFCRHEESGLSSYFLMSVRSSRSAVAMRKRGNGRL